MSAHPDDAPKTIAVAEKDRLDEGKLIELPPGSFYNMPKEMPHFSWTQRGEVIMQVTGEGPSGFKYCDPADDPRTTATR